MMVWIKNVSMKVTYMCDSCGLGYPDARTACMCEEFCKKNNACSPEIAKKASYRP